ncbi:hypothetical protein DPMN_154655 [Dreissena polymorpha]|uniref:Uncharacterized protein n=1 Tax=Dreissena polymorpha TaxID=45954 RepID=A0A9D4FQD1_DREPO|nr:hypothetical protein DPMN_154655 [Dreissena polymorpha]
MKSNPDVMSIMSHCHVVNAVLVPLIRNMCEVTSPGHAVSLSMFPCHICRDKLVTRAVDCEH